ncbi:hypothetical protein TNCV_4310061 [Trichonephila clavipes]|nr:hypothetical protein TNCV_4310061 [Trichonephila clavipes]
MENQLVLFKDPNTKPLDWPMGRILEVFSGSDGLVRVVNVKTSTGRLFPEGWEKKINHNLMSDQIKNLPKNGEGGRTPKHERSIEAERRRGGEERRKERGTAEGSESRW